MKKKMTVTRKAREKYAEHCPVSYMKCDSFSEVDYKIVRAANLGEIKQVDGNIAQVLYHNRILEIDCKRNKVVDIYKTSTDTYQRISEAAKEFYDKIEQKILV